MFHNFYILFLCTFLFCFEVKADEIKVMYAGFGRSGTASLHIALKKLGFNPLDKQTKNGNETGSNLSLSTRLTELSKRLGHKRCCDATPDRFLDVCRLTIFASHCKKQLLRLLPKIEGFGETRA